MNDIIVYTQWEDLSGFSVWITYVTNIYRNFGEIYTIKVPWSSREFDLLGKGVFGLFATNGIRRIQYTTKYE